jgi:hypothetical protein
MSFRAVCGVAFLILAACQPITTTPVKVMAIVPSATANYETRQIELTTVTSIANLKGTVVNLVGGARVEIDPNDPQLNGVTTPEQLADVLQKDKGGDVRANFIDKAGILWPADFHSWAMVTTYFNYEQAFKYYQQIYDGKPTTELLGTRVLYFASYKDLSAADVEIKDNAIFFSPVQAFLVLPFERLQKIPLSLNIGVVGHEFGHLVFNRKAFGGAAIPAPFNTGGWTLEPFNLLKSLDEGLADFHGFGVTCVAPGPGCRPDFLADSFSETTVVEERSMANPRHCMTKELRNALTNLEPAAFLNAGMHYRVGTLIATALYQAAVPVGKVEILQKALISAYDDPQLKPGFKQLINGAEADFTPEEVTNAIAAHITDLDLKKRVCTELTDHLQLNCPSFPCALMPDCGDKPTAGKTCPAP